jgi:hypothetical protein
VRDASPWDAECSPNSQSERHRIDESLVAFPNYQAPLRFLDFTPVPAFGIVFLPNNAGWRRAKLGGPAISAAWQALYEQPSSSF